jgi:biopolymer transport protein ExbD
MKNKKGQIGETITWFVAFVIIFFIVMVFTFITISLSIKSPVKSEEVFKLDTENNQKIIFSILDYKLNYNNQEITLKKALGEYCVNKDNSLKEKIIIAFNSQIKDYYFRIEIIKENPEEEILVMTHQDEGISATYQYANAPGYVVQTKYEVFLINSGGAKIKYNFERKA